MNPATYVRQVLKDTDLVDPDEVARQALSRMADEDALDMLAQSMRQIVVLEMSRLRARSQTSIAKSHKSAFRAAMHAQAESIRRQRVNVNGVWKMLGDCTTFDMDALAGAQHELAAIHTGKAGWYEKGRAAMEEHGADVFNDLPDSVIEALGGAR